jgi:hypothetical protein
VTVGSGPDTLDLKVNEDVWKANAQFTVAVDGTQIGGTLTAQASHAAGAVQDILVMGTFGQGQHTATVDFLNDAYGGTPATDRNLYVAGATIDGNAVSGSSLTLLAAGPESFTFTGAATVSAGTISAQLMAPQTAVAGGTGMMTFINGSAADQGLGTAAVAASGNDGGKQSDPLATVAATVLTGEGPSNSAASDLAMGASGAIVGMVRGADLSGWQTNAIAARGHVVSSLPYHTTDANADAVGATKLFG